MHVSLPLSLKLFWVQIVGVQIVKVNIGRGYAAQAHLLRGQGEGI